MYSRTDLLVLTMEDGLQVKIHMVGMLINGEVITVGLSKFPIACQAKMLLAFSVLV